MKACYQSKVVFLLTSSKSASFLTEFDPDDQLVLEQFLLKYLCSMISPTVTVTTPSKLRVAPQIYIAFNNAFPSTALTMQTQTKFDETTATTQPTIPISMPKNKKNSAIIQKEPASVNMTVRLIVNVKESTPKPQSINIIRPIMNSTKKLISIQRAVPIYLHGYLEITTLTPKQIIAIKEQMIIMILPICWPLELEENKAKVLFPKIRKIDPNS